MLFLPAAALCCLCSALVIMAAELVQDDLTLTRRVGQTVSFSCGRTDQCYNQYVYWYQKKETETFRVILDIDKRNGNIDKGYSSHPQKDDFTSVNKGKGWQLELKKVQLDHSASYYCSCSHSEKRFLQPEQKPTDEQMSNSVCNRKRAGNYSTGADGRSEEPLETTWPSSDLTARPCLASAASELHFSPGSPEETPLHKMLFLPAAALCCLCSALVSMAAQLVQDDLTLTRRVGQTVSFSCEGTGQCSSSYVYWYQKINFADC
ncbi:uncharacterized protein LOC113172085 isoform X1 [Anabas testudineus]|uniref:uncharacterized protein LOC113172085 isoform X1 n=1 Tax=Anabas testudineus TaxID=64144 RepID=UPI000E462879|nr:uncharacterized protein LOC113172085 isoform X1 [Anabas testudineus]